MDEQKWMAYREFAESIGVSDTAVRKAITSGKISEACIDRTNPKRPKINAQKALVEWGKNYVPGYTQSEKLEATLEGSQTKVKDPAPEKKQKVKKAPAPEQKKEQKRIPATGEREVEELAEGDFDTIVLYKDADLKEAKRVGEIAKAKLAMVELKERKDKLIDKAMVQRELFAHGQAIRSGFQGIPDKWIDNIMACADRHEAHAMLTRAIAEVLELLSKPPTLKNNHV